MGYRGLKVMKWEMVPQCVVSTGCTSRADRKWSCGAVDPLVLDGCLCTMDNNNDSPTDLSQSRLPLSSSSSLSKPYPAVRPVPGKSEEGCVNPHPFRMLVNVGGFLPKYGYMYTYAHLTGRQIIYGHDNKSLVTHSTLVYKPYMAEFLANITYDTYTGIPHGWALSIADAVSKLRDIGEVLVGFSEFWSYLSWVQDNYPCVFRQAEERTWTRTPVRFPRSLPIAVRADEHTYISICCPTPTYIPTYVPAAGQTISRPPASAATTSQVTSWVTCTTATTSMSPLKRATRSGTSRSNGMSSRAMDMHSSCRRADGWACRTGRMRPSSKQKLARLIYMIYMYIFQLAGCRPGWLARGIVGSGREYVCMYVPPCVYVSKRFAEASQLLLLHCYFFSL
ncbi:hypothetical protein VOLCADRAFT_107698 [Volvox carteri f. nagariensis]|uniref:Uncharacterized protein n=1 Tax=Volvox carteri f. nagariensis TaxID=3068 RepID=D8UFQ2_VOLCA|nr:uncharacterized protein VOLCADRAFT_107698 [Volvox carteri f. nagariensis]EFJ41417.1 hypothetical protein VOLCADRAFT_107698 [Volvox carteri f. nagariensis]|eukprot:XP_002957523.1 hypothetical protein VOLCADRAFT_107698 [Volvox carteri f. nagariensis]